MKATHLRLSLICPISTGFPPPTNICSIYAEYMPNICSIYALFDIYVTKLQSNRENLAISNSLLKFRAKVQLFSNICKKFGAKSVFFPSFSTPYNILFHKII